jgi:hypothetical protein
VHIGNVLLSKDSVFNRQIGQWGVWVLRRTGGCSFDPANGRGEKRSTPEWKAVWWESKGTHSTPFPVHHM